jgi:hypothetical protein
LIDLRLPPSLTWPRTLKPKPGIKVPRYTHLKIQIQHWRRKQIYPPPPYESWMFYVRAMKNNAWDGELDKIPVEAKNACPPTIC